MICSTCDRLGVIIKNRILTNKYKKELQKRKESEKKLQIFLENTIDFYLIMESSIKTFEGNHIKERVENFFGYSLSLIHICFL